jgi:hypothetical protein
LKLAEIPSIAQQAPAGNVSASQKNLIFVWRTFYKQHKNLPLFSHFSLVARCFFRQIGICYGEHVSQGDRNRTARYYLAITKALAGQKNSTKQCCKVKRADGACMIKSQRSLDMETRPGLPFGMPPWDGCECWIEGQSEWISCAAFEASLGEVE